MDANKLHLQAARLLGKLLATPAGRQFFADNDYKSGMPIVACEWEDRIGEVIERAHREVPPVVLAIRNEEDVCMMTIQPGTPDDIEERGVAHPNSTIGMLYEDSARSKKGTTYQITAWDPTEARAFGSASQLLASN
ncbi:hypothetical protein [Brevibacterium sediminis]|uniref:hypothetical protein n=1 Tax=Brevibacterium sediminis TaxID=1857024 RepID=UPI003B3B8B5A